MLQLIALKTFTLQMAFGKCSQIHACNACDTITSEKSTSASGVFTFKTYLVSLPNVDKWTKMRISGDSAKPEANADGHIAERTLPSFSIRVKYFYCHLANCTIPNWIISNNGNIWLARPCRVRRQRNLRTIFVRLTCVAAVRWCWCGEW